MRKVVKLVPTLTANMRQEHNVPILTKYGIRKIKKEYFLFKVSKNFKLPKDLAQSSI